MVGLTGNYCRVVELAMGGSAVASHADGKTTYARALRIPKEAGRGVLVLS